MISMILIEDFAIFYSKYTYNVGIKSLLQRISCQDIMRVCPIGEYNTSELNNLQLG